MACNYYLVSCFRDLLKGKFLIFSGQVWRNALGFLLKEWDYYSQFMKTERRCWRPLQFTFLPVFSCQRFELFACKCKEVSSSSHFCWLCPGASTGRGEGLLPFLSKLSISLKMRLRYCLPPSSSLNFCLAIKTLTFSQLGQLRDSRKWNLLWPFCRIEGKGRVAGGTRELLEGAE